MAHILLTDGEQRSTLAVTRSLGRAGHAVIVCSAFPDPLAAASRYCVGNHLVSNPLSSPNDFLSEVHDLIFDQDIDFLIPMTDVSASLVLGLRRYYPELAIPFPPEETYRAVSDKEELLRAAREMGVPVPEQVVLRSADEDEKVLLGTVENLQFPRILKPARSAVADSAGVQKYGVEIVHTANDLLRKVTVFPPAAYPLLLQDQIQGPGLGVFALFWEGRPVAWFAHRRIREKPPTGGVSVYRESVPLRSDLEDFASRILSKYHWSGVAMVEFKEDTRSGKPYLMEVNARFWGSLQLAIDSGMDFPYHLIRTAMGETISPLKNYKAGIRSRWLMGDLDHLLTMLRRGGELRRTHPRLPGRLLTLANFLIPWKPGDRFEVLSLSDPGPFLRESGHWFRSIRN